MTGDACDDGNADTESDVIQDDCSCEGSIISSIDNFEALSVLMFPNPATSELNITLNKKSTLKVFDAIGKMVQETGSVLTWALDVSDWEKDSTHYKHKLVRRINLSLSRYLRGKTKGYFK